MNKEKKISILISTFNKSKFIKKTIKSCLIQSYKNYEIIIVDTGSSDGTKKILQFYSKFKKVKVKHVKNIHNTPPLNQIYAIKTALQMAKGQIICLLDGDDLFKKNKLKEINKFFYDNIKVNFVQDCSRNKELFKINRYFLFFKILPKFFTTSTFSIRKNRLEKFFREHNPFDFELLEIDARLFFYSKLFKNDHHLLNKNLTSYSTDLKGISSKYKRFSEEWFRKRNQAHHFLKFFLKNVKYSYKIDFFLSRLFLYLISKLKLFI